MVGQSIGLDVKKALGTFLAIHWVSELVDRAMESHKPSTSSEPVENREKPKPWWEKKS